MSDIKDLPPGPWHYETTMATADLIIKAREAMTSIAEKKADES